VPANTTSFTKLALVKPASPTVEYNGGCANEYFGGLLPTVGYASARLVHRIALDKRLRRVVDGSNAPREQIVVDEMGTSRSSPTRNCPAASNYASQFP
jgi:hypothetical protein